MEAAQFRELLDISVVPSMKIEYYKAMRSKYNHLIHKLDPKLPPKPPEMYLPADGIEAREALMSIFRSVKRGMGYGG